MSETERNKRRFAVYLFNTGPVGVECDFWNIDETGLVFYSGRIEGSMSHFTVLFAAPDQYRSFYELAEGDGWPEPIKYILSDEGRKTK